MEVQSATFTEGNSSIVVVTDEGIMTVPDDMANRDRRRLEAWLVAQGQSIAPYVAPVKGAEEVRKDEFKALPETIDLVDKLKNATPAQIRSYLTANATTVPQLREIVARMLIYMATRL